MDKIEELINRVNNLRGLNKKRNLQFSTYKK